MRCRGIDRVTQRGCDGLDQHNPPDPFLLQSLFSWLPLYPVLLDIYLGGFSRLFCKAFSKPMLLVQLWMTESKSGLSDCFFTLSIAFTLSFTHGLSPLWLAINYLRLSTLFSGGLFIFHLTVDDPCVPGVIVD